MLQCNSRMDVSHPSIPMHYSCVMCLEIRYDEEDSLHGVWIWTWGRQRGCKEKGTGSLIPVHAGECIRPGLCAVLGKKTGCPGGYFCETKEWGAQGRRWAGEKETGETQRMLSWPFAAWIELCFVSLHICYERGTSLSPVPAALQTRGQSSGNASLLAHNPLVMGEGHSSSPAFSVSCRMGWSVVRVCSAAWVEN